MSDYANLITVENIRRIPAEERGECVYIGRASAQFNLPASPLGNPFRLSMYEPQRDATLERYRRWLWADIRAWGPTKDELTRLASKVKRGERVRLMCYCAPASCHGDVVKAAIVWMAEDAP